MAKVIHFKADQDFLDYIKMLGYQHQPVPKTGKLYFTNKGRGCQITVNLKKKKIRFLNKQGFLVDEGVTFTSTEIDKYVKNPDIGLKTNEEIYQQGYGINY